MKWCESGVLTWKICVYLMLWGLIFLPEPELALRWFDSGLRLCWFCNSNIDSYCKEIFSHFVKDFLLNNNYIKYISFRTIIVIARHFPWISCEIVPKSDITNVHLEHFGSELDIFAGKRIKYYCNWNGKFSVRRRYLIKPFFPWDNICGNEKLCVETSLLHDRTTLNEALLVLFLAKWRSE